MAPERYQDKDDLEDKAGAVLAVETLRSCATAVEAPAHQHKGEENVSWFWRIFGGTILSIVALVLVTAYTQLTGTLSDLRHDLGQLQEARADLVKKDELNNRVSSLWNAVKELQTTHHGLATLNERAKILDQQVKTGDDDRRDLNRKIEEQRRIVTDEYREFQRKMEDQFRQVQNLAERLAGLEGRNAGAGPTVPASGKKLIRIPGTN